jgi:hypothetical protein
VKLGDPGAIAVITGIGGIAVAAIGGLVNWLIKRQARPVDAATARKIEAETVAEEVKTARELLAEVKEYFRERLAAQAAEHKQETEELRQELSDLRTRVQTVEMQTQAMRLAWMVHRAWDETAWTLLRVSNPDYPAPPPVDGL